MLPVFSFMLTYCLQKQHFFFTEVFTLIGILGCECYDKQALYKLGIYTDPSKCVGLRYSHTIRPCGVQYDQYLKSDGFVDNEVSILGR